ncbi:MAG: hypothetical protein ACRDNY_07295 [Gaiellaceae bacterium]
MLRRRLVAVSLVVVTALVAGALATGSTSARSAVSATGVETIATARTSDFRVVVKAERRGGGAAPAATVTLTTFQRLRGNWQRIGVHRLDGPYFWKVVTGPRAVCRLDVRTTAARASFQPRATVRLLLSPSLGCGPPSSFALTR